MSVHFTDREAQKYRDLIRQAAESLGDEDAAGAPLLSEPWAPGADYPADKRLSHEGLVYRTTQAHRSQADWPPTTAVSLYARVLAPDPDVIDDWQQPESTEGYALGARVRHVGRIWISDYANNIWEPGVFGWHEEEDTE